MSITTKLQYLNDTKELIRQALNTYFYADLTTSDTFRSYATFLQTLASRYPTVQLTLSQEIPNLELHDEIPNIMDLDNIHELHEIEELNNEEPETQEIEETEELTDVDSDIEGDENNE